MKFCRQVKEYLLVWPTRKEHEFKCLENFLPAAHFPSKGFKSKYYPTVQVKKKKLNDISKDTMQSTVRYWHPVWFISCSRHKDFCLQMTCTQVRCYKELKLFMFPTTACPTKSVGRFFFFSLRLLNGSFLKLQWTELHDDRHWVGLPKWKNILPNLLTLK